MAVFTQRHNITIQDDDQQCLLEIILATATNQLKPTTSRRTRSSSSSTNHSFPCLIWENLSNDDKYWLVSIDTINPSSRRVLCEWYHLTRSALEKCIKRALNGEPLKGEPGRRVKVDLEDRSDLSKEIRDAYWSRTPMHFDDIVSRLKELCAEKYARNHTQASAADIEQASTLSPLSVDRYLKSMEVTKRNAQKSTRARQIACEDIRHTFSLLVALYTFCIRSPPNLKLMLMLQHF